jgi:aspartokinase/homoserine dehydrogenase 1
MPENQRPLIVSKFGGSSVGDADRIRNVTQIVDSTRTEGRLIVVVSALAGMTDDLVKAIEIAITRTDLPSGAVAALVDRYEKVAGVLLSGDAQSELYTFVNHYWAELGELLDGIYLLRECTPRTRDAVISIGELVTAPLVTAVLAEAGIAAAPVDARQLIRTDADFGEANVDMEVTYQVVRDYFTAVADDVVAVVTGFVATTADGVTATLGRSGSDYTATLLGGALHAARVDIWTDVDGVLSADPRIVKDAFTIDALSYAEAGELAYFGAKVLHPRTMRPLLAHSIPLHIKNSFNPGAAGTVITPEGKPSGGRVKAITSVRGVAVVMIEGTGMAGVPGVSARAFSALAGDGINVLMMSQASSEQSICIVVMAARADAAVQSLIGVFDIELTRQDVSRIYSIRDCAILSAVGDRMRHKPGLAGRMFSALGRCNVNVLAIAQGASESNISTVIEEVDLRPALTTLHAAFARSQRRAHLFVFGAGGVASALLQLLARQQSWLQAEQQIDLSLVGVANSRSVIWNEEGIDPQQAVDGLKQSGGPSSVTSILERLLSSKLDRLIVVDATASPEVSGMYGALLRRGIAVVTANKKASSASQLDFDALRAAQREGRVPYLSETTVGAALPVLVTIRELVDSGDQIVRIRAILSGTLSFVFNEVSDGRAFSQALMDAMSRGFTEPDPREDLRGADVRRKLVILAREMGLRIEPDEVVLESILDDSLHEGDIDSFLARIPGIDAAWSERARQAGEEGFRIQYVGEIGPDGARASIEHVDRSSPLGSLAGTDNLFEFETVRHKGNPLVVRGPGAGPETTAGGVFADIMIAARTIN